MKGIALIKCLPRRSKPYSGLTTRPWGNTIVRSPLSITTNASTTGLIAVRAVRGANLLFVCSAKYNQSAQDPVRLLPHAAPVCWRASAEHALESPGS